MELIYLGHSGFAIKAEDYLVVIDYYEDKSNLLSELFKEGKKVYVLVSHHHHDHFNPEIFKFDTYCTNVTFILSDDIDVDFLKKDYFSNRLLLLKKGEYLYKGLWLNR